MEIKEVPLPEVWQLRQEVMYPDASIEFVKLADDAKGMHLGVYEEEELMSVISVFISGQVLQFRKFATKTQQQGKGYGSSLLKVIFQLAEEKSCTSVWCSARTTAKSLYLRFGMEEKGEPFMKNGIEYIIMEKKI